MEKEKIKEQNLNVHGRDINLRRLSVEEFVEDRLRSLRIRKSWYKFLWISIRLTIVGINLVVLCVVFYALWLSVVDYRERIINFDTFWGTVGPTIFLCVLIIALFAATMSIIFFKSKMQVHRYKAAMHEIQENVIHFHYSKKQYSKEEKIQRIQDIYDRAMSKMETTTFIHAVRENVLGEE